MRADYHNFTGIVVRKNFKHRIPTYLQYKVGISKTFQVISSHEIAENTWNSGDLTHEKRTLILRKIQRQESFVPNGAWSIVNLSEDLKTLFLVRDSLGIHPLYYHLDTDYFAFATSVQNLIKLVETPLNINHNELFQMFLFNKMERSDQTLIDGIKEVKQGHFVDFDFVKWKVQSTRYLAQSDENESGDFSDVVKRNRVEIDRFVQKKVGHHYTENHTLLLSGGLDSSCLAHSLTQFLPPQNLSFLTMKYTHKSIGESHFAKEVAALYPQNNWNCITTDGPEFLADIETMHRIIEWPTLSAGTYNQYKMLKHCFHSDQNIIWDGLGADALYGGHDYYRHRLIILSLKAVKMRAVAELLNWKGKSLIELQNSIRTAVKNKTLNLKLTHQLFLNYKNELKIYNPDFLSQMFSADWEDFVDNSSSLKEMMKSDFYDGGVRHLSRFTNRISTHFGLKMIYPYAENLELAEVIFKSNIQDFYKNGASKAILRESYKAHLPESIYLRKDKKGLQSPNNQWIQSLKEHWIEYFDESLGDVYNIRYLKENYNSLWEIGHKNENYRHFKHISFAIWRRVVGI